MVTAEAINQIGKSARIVHDTFGGHGHYDAATNAFVGTIWDVDGNVYEDSGTVAMGTGCEHNRFGQRAQITIGDTCFYNDFGINTNITLGNDCNNNTFKANAQLFVFGDNLRNLSVDANVTGANYTASPDYDFLYNQEAATIVTDGVNNYHILPDPANDRYVVTLMTAPYTVSYIGGGGGTGDVVGPASAVADNIVLFDGITGKLIKDSGVALSAKLDVAAAANYRLVASDGSGNRGNVGAITAARALKSDANGIPTHFDTATEPSLTELSYVKGVTSAIQTQINAIKTDTITFSADGSGGVITIGRSGGFWRCPYNCTITGWYLQEGGNVSSSCVIDTWISNAYPPTVANTIWSIGDPKPALTLATNNSSTLATPISVTAGEWIGFNIDSCSNALYLTLVLIVTKP